MNKLTFNPNKRMKPPTKVEFYPKSKKSPMTKRTTKRVVKDVRACPDGNDPLYCVLCREVEIEKAKRRERESRKRHGL